MEVYFFISFQESNRPIAASMHLPRQFPLSITTKRMSQTLEPAPHAPAYPRFDAHRPQVRHDEIPNLIQLFQIATSAARYMSDMATPDTPTCSFSTLFDPDPDDERLGCGLDLIHNCLFFSSSGYAFARLDHAFPGSIPLYQEGVSVTFLWRLRDDRGASVASQKRL
jgi:hypothetical protein